jgi:hypothetical protein
VGKIVVLPLADTDLQQLSDLLDQHIMWSAETLELIRMEDPAAANMTRPQCTFFENEIHRILLDGRLDCGEDSEVENAVRKRVRALSEGSRMAIRQVLRFLAETKARELFWRTQAAIEFKQEAFNTVDSLLQGTDDPAKRIAAVAIIDLAWRQMASEMIKAIRERKKDLPLTGTKDLGELAQYLYQDGAIDLNELAALKGANQIRNDALHAANLAAVPTRDRVLQMIGRALEYRSKHGFSA